MPSTAAARPGPWSSCECDLRRLLTHRQPGDPEWWRLRPTGSSPSSRGPGRALAHRLLRRVAGQPASIVTRQADRAALAERGKGREPRQLPDRGRNDLANRAAEVRPALDGL